MRGIGLEIASKDRLYPSTLLLHTMTRPSRANSTSSRKIHGHNPLSEDIVATGPLRTKSKKRKSRPGDDENKYVDSKSSRKILRIGQDLADEIDGESKIDVPNSAFAFESRFGDDEEITQAGQDEDEEAWGDEDEEFIEEIVRTSISI